jgi:HEPN domain-containing protein
MAEYLLSATHPFVRGALFHCQQAVEKLLKGALLNKGRTFRRTHDLVTLGEECIEVQPALAEVIRPSYALTQYAVQSRYPGDWDELTVDEAGELLRIAKHVMAAIASADLNTST